MYLGIDLMRTEYHLTPKLTQISPQKRAPPVKSEREIEYVQRQKGEEVPPESPLLHVVAHDQSPGGNCIKLSRCAGMLQHTQSPHYGL